ncbi:MAG: PEGA domain-containing protein [Minicystis sp.]
MLAPRIKRRAAALAFALLPRRGLGPAFAAALLLAAPPLAAQADSYKLHMENGVKLYNDRNWVAAIVEFRAAYEARPNANPLFNIALCEKELYRYHKAIATLETALAKHGSTMDPPDRKAAEDAIKDMRALLGRVVVTTIPPDATLLVDGDELPAEAARKPIELGPGPHKIEAHADGFASTERTVTVASGKSQDLTIELSADKGLVTVHAPDPRMTISIDQRIVGTGAWSGMLSPGTHLVQMSGTGGAPFEGQILVIAGKPLDVRPGAGVAPKKDEPALRRGLYILGTGSLLFSITHPPAFIDPKFDLGGAYGLRIGFQVNNFAGFDLSYEHSSISTSQKNDDTGEKGYRILSDRVAAALRLSSPGKVWRFVGTIGGGFVVNGVKFGQFVRDPSVCDISNGNPCPFGVQGSLGVDAFALFEAGAELDLDHVLIDLGIEAQFQSTGNLTSMVKVNGMDQELGIYGAHPIVNMGPALRVGYRFW